MGAAIQCTEFGGTHLNDLGFFSISADTVTCLSYVEVVEDGSFLNFAIYFASGVPL